MAVALLVTATPWRVASVTNTGQVKFNVVEVNQNDSDTAEKAEQKTQHKEGLDDNALC